jgi:phosphate transport system substrate-binding protein
MKRNKIRKAFVVLPVIFLFFVSSLEAKEILKYSSSAVVMAAIGEDVLKLFTEETGVEIDLFIGSSDTAIHRMMNGVADIASSVERIGYGSIDYGYNEILFARAPIAVITNVSTTVRDLTISQLSAIFSGAIENWKDVGGPNQKIIVVIPSHNTGAFKNFSLLTLKRLEVKYDYMAFRSTAVVDIVTHIPYSISFISLGAHTAEKAIKIISIDGRKPEDDGYPFSQDFSFVTIGEPKGASKKMIDFFMSEKVKTVFQKNGIMSINK